MTREEAKELLPIIQAFAEGKVINIETTQTSGQILGKMPAQVLRGSHQIIA